MYRFRSLIVDLYRYSGGLSDGFPCEACPSCTPCTREGASCTTRNTAWNRFIVSRTRIIRYSRESIEPKLVTVRRPRCVPGDH